jgi:hypothetical protein
LPYQHRYHACNTHVQHCHQAAYRVCCLSAHSAASCVHSRICGRIGSATPRSLPGSGPHESRPCSIQQSVACAAPSTINTWLSEYMVAVHKRDWLAGFCACLCACLRLHGR